MQVVFWGQISPHTSGFVLCFVSEYIFFYDDSTIEYKTAQKNAVMDLC